MTTPSAAETSLPAGTWTIDPSHTSVTIAVKKLGFINVEASLAVESGTIEIDGDQRVVSVAVVADAASYTSGNPKRDDHVRGSDFLDSESHPHLEFAADQVVASGGGHRATGTVTVKSATAPLTLDVSDVSVAGSSGSFTATGTVDRTAIGVDKFPTFVIGRTLTITVACTASLATA
ncbi:MAG: YceI family protein [Actinomycetota bacterium]